MRQITLRGIPSDIESVAQDEARSKGVSLNKAILSLLRRGIELKAHSRRSKKSEKENEFSQFLGAWGEEDAAMFDRSLRDQRAIDEDLWL